ncbi:MAG: MarR family transcriptional regulator [Deltaproteobacteria bacterium]|nr:MarR family transcriptional regulator [Deltaproteobacteria bacterium]MBW2201044.1 MarR family transcriptional regulator [Deltaproteobacteria bacterium]MBW2538761.1 MarR family transcriptional regulator [Deltaproteobacteria bacterium]
MKKKINIGVADAVMSAKDFIDVWKRAERGKAIEAEYKIHFQSLETLLKTLTAGRWVLLKALHKSGPMSIRGLSNELGRDYKNVHTDVRKLENAGLISRTEDDRIEVPWDTVEARFQLAA